MDTFDALVPPGPDRRFDREDERTMTSLSRFTAAAYRTLTQVGALERFLR